MTKQVKIKDTFVNVNETYPITNYSNGFEIYIPGIDKWDH